MKRALSLFAIVLVLSDCNRHPAANPNGDSPSLLSAAARLKSHQSASIASISPALLKQYQETCRHDTASNDKQFLDHFLEIIHKFSGKKLDTTLLTIGNLAGGPEEDTIYSRVYYHGDSIVVDSRWIKMNKVLWHDRYRDPYTELDGGFYRDTSRNTWVCFAVGILYGPPDIHMRDEVDSGVNNLILDQGLHDLHGAGVHIDKAQYKAYLAEFTGNLLAYGQPESREGVWIWYKPAGLLINYFQP